MGEVFFFSTKLFRTVFLLWTSTSITVLAMTHTAEANHLPFDPFVPYADILPRHSQGDIEAHGFKCLSQRYMPQCSISLAVGPISEIKVDISLTTDHVTRVAFILRENLTLGHLIRLWGKPQINVLDKLVYFYWPRSRITATAHLPNHHISYWLPITIVAFHE
jgi:hypothetical protein